MKEHVDPKDATDHEITPLTILAACRHLNEATPGSCPNIFPSDALVIIREPGFLYSRSQRVLGLSRLWQVKRSKPLVFNSHIPLSTLHGRQTEMGGRQKWEATDIFLAHSFHQDRVTGQQKKKPL